VANEKLPFALKYERDGKMKGNIVNAKCEEHDERAV